MRRIAFTFAMLVAITGSALAPFAAAAPRNREPLSPNQIGDEVDARSAKLKADLRLTDDQSKNWASLQAALHDIAVGRANRDLQQREAPDGPRDRRAREQDLEQGERSNVPDEIERMRREADFLAERAADLRKFADAAGPLYSSLDDGQKRRFIQYLRSARRNVRDRFR